MTDFSYTLQESFCQYALTIQFFLNKGWRIVDIKYGEQKFDIGTAIVAERDGERQTFTPDEIEFWVRKEYQ